MYSKSFNYEGKMMKKGKLIAIDGIDGSGKSTLALEVAENLSAQYYSVFNERYMIKEMEDISNKLNKNYHDVFSERFINYAWMVDMFSVAINDLNTLLDTGKNVVLDRYILSAEVYSLATTNADISNCFSVYSLLPKPDLCIYLLVDIDTAIMRIKDRKKKCAYYENVLGLNRIAQKYKEMIPLEKEYPISIVDGNSDIQTVLQNCLTCLRNSGIINNT